MVDSTNLPDVNINQIATDLNGKMDKDGVNATASVCIESWHEGTEWYRVYSDGWCEQGGIIAINTNPKAVNFSKNFANTNYTISAIVSETYTGNSARVVREYSSNRTSSSFSVYVTSGNQDVSGLLTGCNINWEAKGYIR